MNDVSKPISTRKLDDEAINKFIEEFKNESDRAAVVLGAAKLDLLLYQIIQQYLLPVTTPKDELLDGDSPLGTFSAKISLVSRLGLVDPEFIRALQFVRKIRNAFAHEVSGCTLETGSHRDRVKELVGQMKRKTMFVEIRNTVFSGNDDPKSNFRTALAFLVIRLEILLNQVTTVDGTSAFRIFNEKMLAKGEVEYK